MKYMLVIDIDDDVAKNYKALTVNYDLRGDYGEWDESIKYVEDADVRPLPQRKKVNEQYMSDGLLRCEEIMYVGGWNDCLDEITGETE